MIFGTTSADGNSNVMGHFGYARQGAVYSKDRPASAVDQNSLIFDTGLAADAFTPVRPFFSSFAPQGRFFHDSGSFTFDRNGNVIPWSTNGSATQAATGFNRSEFRTIAVPTERYLFATSGNLAINENHRAFFEGNYASTRVSTKTEPFALGADDIYPASGGQVPAEFSGFNRGNPNLHAEKGKSTTVGIVLTPRSIPMLSKFSFTADYFKIDIEDAIVETPRQFALDSCYGGGNPSFCSFITRRPASVGANSAGSLEFIDSAVSNSGGKGTEGVDVTASWTDRVGPGRLGARLAYTYVKERFDIPLLGAEKDPFASEVGAAKNKAALTLGYRWGAFNISSNTTYIGPSALDDTFLKQFDLPARSVKLSKKVYNDFQLTYTVRKQLELYVGVDNAFDTKPPPLISGLPGNTTGAETDAGTYDAIGRRYYAGLRMTL